MLACPYQKEGNTVKFSKTWKWVLNRKLTCKNKNIIYMIECKKTNCKENQYIGETGIPLKYCLAKHKPYVVNQINSISNGPILTPQAWVIDKHKGSLDRLDVEQSLKVRIKMW